MSRKDHDGMAKPFGELAVGVLRRALEKACERAAMPSEGAAPSATPIRRSSPSADADCGHSNVEEKSMAKITNPRGARAAWGELFDALVVGVHVLGGGGRLSQADRTILVVTALQFWPDHSVPVMVDRVRIIEESIIAGGLGHAEALIADRSILTMTYSSMLRPVLLAGSLRELTRLENARLASAIAAAGDDPARYGLAA